MLVDLLVMSFYIYNVVKLYISTINNTDQHGGPIAISRQSERVIYKQLNKEKAHRRIKHS